MTRRWRAIDPLLPADPPVAAATPGGGGGCLAGLTVAAGRELAATADCEHRALPLESLDASWGAARQFRLVPRVAGPDVAGALDALLARWREHLAGVPGAGDEDGAAVVLWPSRDVAGVQPLLRHGFAPVEVLAARPSRRGPDAGGGLDEAGAGPGAGVRIRRAGPGDIEAVTRLGVEVIRFDSHFGSVTERPGTAEAMRREVAALLAGPRPWTWLAERDDGTAVGMLAAQRPEAAGWIAGMTGRAPAAYLMLAFVAPGARAGGVGGALVARLHREVEAAGVAVTLLHYEQVNPLSAPFWSQQGYRPLWTSWEVRPPRAVR